MSQDDFVARTKLAPDGTAEGKSQGSHVRSENDLIGIAAQEVRHGGTCACNQRVGVATGRVCTARVGVVALQIIGNRVDDALWNLSSSGTIEKSGGMAVDGLHKRRELGANPGKIERGGRFVLNS